MKANKKTLIAVKNFFEHQEGWNLDELVSTILEETKLLNRKELDGDMVATDECYVCWGDDPSERICGADELIESYTRIFVEKVCNTLESFVGEDLSNYNFEE